MFAKIVDNLVVKYPCNMSDVRQEFPETSIPDGVIEQFGYVNVEPTPTPVFNQLAQRLVQEYPILVNDVWIEKWRVDNLPEQQASANVRAKRDQLLRETDWCVIKALESNTSQDFEWAVYRQALRDITTQTGFPWTIDWPVNP